MRVGIGTITLVATLEIQSLSASMRQTRYSNTASQSAGLTVQRSGGTTVGTDVIVQDDWRIANFNLRGYDGFNYLTAVGIQAWIDGTPGVGDMPGRLTFLTTADGANSATERMRIDSSGNVGINTTTPQNTLNVIGELNITENATFGSDVIINGTLFGGSPVKIAGINITNNLFTLKENRNSSSRFTLRNLNDGSNASAVIEAINNMGSSMFFGIGSSNFMLGNIGTPNITVLLSRSRGNMIFGNSFNKPFVWYNNPSDDNDLSNLEELMRLNENTLNVSVNIHATENFTVTKNFFLSNDYSLPAGQNKILKRNSVTKAVFGVSNNVGSASNNTGAGYSLNNSHGQYDIDLHSGLDLRNPNDTVHHLLGSNNREIWRLNPTADSSFRFESSLDTFMLKINRTGTEINQTLIIGTSASPQNITMFSPDGTRYSCGVLNGGTFACS